MTVREGDKVICGVCRGAGYVRGVSQQPYLCKGCNGTGEQTIVKAW